MECVLFVQVSRIKSDDSDFENLGFSRGRGFENPVFLQNDTQCEYRSLDINVKIDMTKKKQKEPNAITRKI